jgi:hypothetical protein
MSMMELGGVMAQAANNAARTAHEMALKYFELRAALETLAKSPRPEARKARRGAWSEAALIRTMRESPRPRPWLGPAFAISSSRFCLASAADIVENAVHAGADFIVRVGAHQLDEASNNCLGAAAVVAGGGHFFLQLADALALLLHHIARAAHLRRSPPLRGLGFFTRVAADRLRQTMVGLLRLRRF